MNLSLSSPPVRQKAWPARHLFGEAEKQAANRLFDRAIQTGAGIGYAGEEEAAYCADFSAFLGGGYADAVNSGTNALFVALAALDLPPYSEVIVPPITDAGGVMPVSILQCLPIPADTAPGSFNVGAEQIAARITPRTRAIVVMHAAGLPVEMEPVMQLARKHGLKVVEDCAQAHGSLHHGRPVGTFGEVAAFSTMFGKTHAFGGQGGVVFTRDEALYHRVREFSDRGKPFGRPPGVRNVVASLNFNTDELHCAIGRVQLGKLPQTIERRRTLGNALAARCEELAHVRMVCGGPADAAAYWYLLFRFEAEHYTVPKAEFVAALTREGIPFEADYNFIPSDYEWFQNRHSLGTSGLPWCAPQAAPVPEQWALPNARQAVAEHFRLPFHENLTLDDMADIATALRKVEAVYLRR